MLKRFVILLSVLVLAFCAAACANHVQSCTESTATEAQLSE